MKSIYADLRKVESTQTAQKRATPQSACLRSDRDSATTHSGNSSSHDAQDSHLSVNGSGSDDCEVSGRTGEEFRSILEALQNKVQMIEHHYGEQIRALVAKMKALHKTVKEHHSHFDQGDSGSDVFGRSATAPVTSDEPPAPPLGKDWYLSAAPPHPEVRNGDSELALPPPSKQETSSVATSMGKGASGMSDAMSKILALAGSPEAANQERESQSARESGNALSMLTESNVKVDAHTRMLEREAVLLDRISRQEEKVAKFAKSEVRLAEAEGRIKELEGALSRLQQLQTVLGNKVALDEEGVSPSPVDEQGGMPRKQRRGREYSGRPTTATGTFRTAGSIGSANVSAVEAGNNCSSASPNDSASSRLSLWANIRDRMFGGGASKARILNLTILEATFHDTSRNQKLPLDAFIEIRNITTGQVEMTHTVRKSYKPRYNAHFIFRTKQNANDMIMMKIMENYQGKSPAIFGSVALPLDSKHTQGAQIPMPIFDEGLNMKGVVRVAAQWEINWPRQVRVSLFALRDIPEDTEATGVTVRFFSSKSASSQTAKPAAIAGGGGGGGGRFVSFEGQVLDHMELCDEEDRLQVEVLMLPSLETTESTVSFGKATVPIRKDGATHGHEFLIVSEDGSKSLTMQVKVGFDE